ncbi:MAG: NBR1-Ig-like domain-containing protein [Pontiellaceae bacterium]|jgi:hypothetical protein|nr:NBR1-Ig-like domain-containing protein [Pontiellaceae bacterium]
MKNMKTTFSKIQFTRTAIGLWIVFLCGLGNTGWCGRIIRPWRATTSIVKAGESFDVWFIADAGQTVTNVVLNGPYNTVNPTMAAPATGTWVYDPISTNTYNTRITVTVPSNAPADRYDLVLQTSAGDVTSDAAAKVIREYKDEYYILHMSDVHRWQGGYDPTQLMRKVSAIIDIANIIDPEMIIETGDNYYCWTSNDVQTAARANLIFDGMPTLNIKGEHDAFAATFMLAGNHDTPNKDITKDPVNVAAAYFNKYFGLHIYNFTYGEGRFLCINDAWGGGAINYTLRATEARAWLDSVGWGNFILAAGHCKGSGMDQTILKTSPHLDIILAGHEHSAGDSNPYPTNGINQYVANSVREANKFEFNLFKVDAVNGTYVPVSGASARVPVIQTMNNSTIISNWAGWIPNVSLAYLQTNNGAFLENTATISNKYNFPITGARVRFVMPLGCSYGISHGVIAQEFDGDNFHIVDVRVDLSAASTTSVDIFSTSAAANNAQFISQDVPDSLEPGETAAVSITMKNTGTNVWSAASGHQLGSQTPPNNTLWTGTNRITLSESVSPGDSHTFVFDITAPDTPGNYNFQWKMVDDAEPDSGWFGQSTPAVAIPVAEVLHHGTVLLAVDLHQNSTDPVPVTPPGFIGWTIGEVAALSAAPSITTNGYTVTLGSGTSAACLTTPALQTGMNSRYRLGYVTNAGAFTQESMMRERVGSLVNPIDPSTGNGTGNGLYLKISGLASNTPYIFQAWGVDSTGTNPAATLKNGDNYGFNATAEPAGYSSLPLVGFYTVSGSPSVIMDNNQYSVMGTITSDTNGTIVYKQISTIDRSIMNGFMLSTVPAQPSGYAAWAATNGITGGPTDDDDGDGLNNFSEYAVREKPAFIKSGDTFDYIYLQRNDDPNLIYSVETTTNLLSEVWINTGGTAQTNVIGGSYDEITRTIPLDHPMAYLRLKITGQ